MKRLRAPFGASMREFFGDANGGTKRAWAHPLNIADRLAVFWLKFRKTVQHNQTAFAGPSMP